MEHINPASLLEGVIDAFRITSTVVGALVLIVIGVLIVLAIAGAISLDDEEKQEPTRKHQRLDRGHHRVVRTQTLDVKQHHIPSDKSPRYLMVAEDDILIPVTCDPELMDAVNALFAVNDDIEIVIDGTVDTKTFSMVDHAGISVKKTAPAPSGTEPVTA